MATFLKVINLSSIYIFSKILLKIEIKLSEW